MTKGYERKFIILLFLGVFISPLFVYAVSSNDFPPFNSEASNGPLDCIDLNNVQNCYFRVQIDQLNNYQAYKGRVYISVFDVQDTRGLNNSSQIKVEMCLDNGGNFGSGIACSTIAEQYLVPGQNIINAEMEIGLQNLQPAGYVHVHVRIQKAASRTTVYGYGRRAHIDSLSAPSAVNVGQNFLVSWSSTNTVNNATFYFGGPITCTAPNGSSVGTNDNAQCTATGAGLAQIELRAYGPVGSSGSGADDVSDTRDINISAIPPPPSPPPPPPGSFNLTVNRGIEGSVFGPGISCGSDCSEPYPSGTNVSLTANPNSGFTTSWSGCNSSSGNSCSVTMDSNKTVIVNFSDGGGGPPPEQPTCTGWFTNASGPPGSSTTFNWTSNDADGQLPLQCTGSIGQGMLSPAIGNITFSMPSDPQTCAITSQNSLGSFQCSASVGQSVDNRNLSILKNGTGSGIVTGPGISCGSSCFNSYPVGSPVTLSATPSGDSTLSNWSGCDSGANGNQCTLTMDSNKTVTATFNLNSAPPEVCEDPNANNQGQPLPCTYPPPGSVVESCDINISGTSSVDIKANGSDGPISIDFNTPANLTWDSSSVGSCNASGDWSGSKALSGSQSTGNLNQIRRYAFTLSCSGISSTSDTVFIDINSQSPMVSDVTSVGPDYCVSGPVAIVNWSYSDPLGSPQSKYQVQIDNDLSFNSPEVDSGVVSCGACRSYATSLGLLQFNNTYRARVRVWNQFDVVSPWTESSSWSTPPHAYPQVNFTWAPANIKINSSVQFTDQTIFNGPVGGRSWQWVFGNGDFSGQQNPSTMYSMEGSYNPTLTATDAAGQSCSLSKPLNIQKSLPKWKEILPR